MAVVIHTIKGNQYAYDHHREGGRVVSTYIGPVGGKSTDPFSAGGYSIREPMHGGGAPKKEDAQKVTQQEVKPEVKEQPKEEEKKTINTNRHNIDIADKQKGNTMNSTEQKLSQAGWKIIEAPSWILKDKIANDHPNIIEGRAALKIEKETDKAVYARGVRIPKEELTDSQKATVMSMYSSRVPVWIPKSQIKFVE